MKNFDLVPPSWRWSAEKGRNVNSVGFLSSEFIQSESDFAGIGIPNLATFVIFLKRKV